MRIYTSKDIRQVLKISQRMLDYHLGNTIEDVLRTSSNMRIFSEQDIERIKNHLGNRINEEDKVRD